MTGALLCSLAYWLCIFVDDMMSWQTFQRPIVIGTVVGAICGDLKAGIILGAELEAVYMGVSAIGGVVASKYDIATAVGVGLMILSDLDIETAMAFCIPIGTVLTTVSPIIKLLMDLLTPFYHKLEEAGNYKGYHILAILQTELIQGFIQALCVFLCVYIGSEAVNAFLSVIPEFVLNGLNKSASLLVVVGLAILSQCIWSSTTPVWVILGFMLSSYFGMTTGTIAVIGVMIAFLTFKSNYSFNELKLSLQNRNNNGGDDFYA